MPTCKLVKVSVPAGLLGGVLAGVLMVKLPPIIIPVIAECVPTVTVLLPKPMTLRLPRMSTGSVVAKPSKSVVACAAAVVIGDAAFDFGVEELIVGNGPVQIRDVQVSLDQRSHVVVEEIVDVGIAAAGSVPVPIVDDDAAADVRVGDFVKVGPRAVGDVRCPPMAEKPAASR